MFDGTSRSDEIPARRLQRAVGRARIVVGPRDGCTVLRDLYQQGSMKARFPRVFGTGGPEAVLINTAGGLTGGDNMTVDIRAQADSRLTVTTQACERVYKSSGGHAHVSSNVKIGTGAEICWLPQETIFFEGGALKRTLSVDMAEDSRFIAIEAVTLGRAAMGETVTKASFRDSWRVRRAGKLVFADETRLGGNVPEAISGSATLNGMACFATLLMVSSDAEARLDAAREALGGAPESVIAGASAFDGFLTARLAAPDQQPLRAAALHLIQTLRDGADIPRVWNL